MILTISQQAPLLLNLKKMMGLERGWKCNLLNVNLRKRRAGTRLRGILTGDRLRKKDLMHYVDLGVREQEPPQQHPGEPVLGSCGKPGGLNQDPLSKGLLRVFPLLLSLECYA